MKLQGKAGRRRRKWKIVVGGLLAGVALCLGAFFWYVSDYYHADARAMAIAQQGTGIETVENLTVLSPDTPSDTAIIFYPGAKVQAEAYLPLLDTLRQSGLICVLVHMPFHLAVLDVNAAQDVIDRFPEVTHWYVAGHSMGGAMASRFAAGHPDAVDGVILLGAYLYGDYPAEDTLTVYGSLNSSVAEKIDYTDNVVVIDGGNHAQFGNYGPQKGDLPAEISAEEQQAQAVEAIQAFLVARA